MPYASISELSESVRRVLPEHAQEIYKDAFNNAYEEYAKAEDRHDGSGREETAYRVAWSAVKKSGYSKDEDGIWRKA